MRTEDLLAKPITWSVVTSATNATATATKTGIATKQHAIAGISVSASGQPSAAVSVKIYDGVTVLDQWEIPPAQFAPILHNYTRVFLGSPAADVSVSVTTMGPGITCTLVLKGFTGMAP